MGLQDEIARLNGLTADGEMSPEQQLLQAEVSCRVPASKEWTQWLGQIVELVPHVAEASAIATQLKVAKDFNIEVVSSFNAKDGSTSVPKVKVRHLLDSGWSTLVYQLYRYELTIQIPRPVGCGRQPRL